MPTIYLTNIAGEFRFCRPLQRFCVNKHKRRTFASTLQSTHCPHMMVYLMGISYGSFIEMRSLGVVTVVVSGYHHHNRRNNKTATISYPCESKKKWSTRTVKRRGEWHKRGLHIMVDRYQNYANRYCCPLKWLMIKVRNISPPEKVIHTTKYNALSSSLYKDRSHDKPMICWLETKSVFLMNLWLRWLLDWTWPESSTVEPNRMILSSLLVCVLVEPERTEQAIIHQSFSASTAAIQNHLHPACRSDHFFARDSVCWSVRWLGWLVGRVWVS